MITGRENSGGDPGEIREKWALMRKLSDENRDSFVKK
jgi:hypothetical protein